MALHDDQAAWYKQREISFGIGGKANLLHHMGGTPVRLVLDNATGVGRWVGAVVQLTDLFGRFQAYYGF